MKAVRYIMAVVVAALGLVLMPASATAAPCGGTYTIGVGGVSQGNSALFFNVSQRVGWSALPFGFSVQEGTNELNRLFDIQRRQCPSQYVKVIGHSAGAAAVHNWLTQRDPVNVSAVLLADPKRPGTEQGTLPGAAGNGTLGFIGYPLVGTDNFYGRSPVLQVCNRIDPVCNGAAPLFGYFTGGHTNYNYDVNRYPDRASGTWIL